MSNYYQNYEAVENAGRRIHDFPNANAERAYHLNLEANDRYFQREAKEGASHITETLGMHFVKPESQ